MSKLRPNIFGKAMAINGDKTTAGATCIATIQNVKLSSKMALRVGDPTTICPKCGQAGKIVTGENRINNHGKVQTFIQHAYFFRHQIKKFTFVNV